MHVELASRLQARFLGEGALVAGVLSGTSADGIDVGLTRMRARRDERHAQRVTLAAPELLHYECVAFSPELHARVRAVLDGAATNLRATTFLHRDLGFAFGAAVADVARRAGLELDLVGSHGQTVWHHDGQESAGRASLQLGDGDCVSEACGAPVVSDFRARDLAAGGEGAPISALADEVIFAHVERPLAILNLGGMANLTLLGAHPDDVSSFDTGPANSLLDGLARRLLDRPFDAEGREAAAGRVNEDLVRRVLEHPFFSRLPPKSTGRDTFGMAWVEGIVVDARQRGLLVHRPNDLLATAVEIVARSVALGLSASARGAPDRVLVCGGGIHHVPLRIALERACGRRIQPAQEVGVDPDAREALVFAVLAARAVLGIPSTRPETTGAAAGRILGKLSPPAVKQADA